ncbi:flagellar biosynthesis protein FlgE [Alsobacter soli]|uniref:Flagellar hook protein FlgE n=1 Tax=Alsobacter soli TaxID=2109933 RepID=A0A2T1HUE0_9HYPH|nr:flagellar hook-basal body complex protein [Alsobacter soli]PSC05210.1 flagellar biosynthesis protein FlgE [Alsobacter soli]
MSLFGAMTSSVTGLRAQSYALENISDNIANSQTTGYKRVDTSFQDMVPDFPVAQQVGGSVMAKSRGTTTLSGSYSTTGVATNMSLTGDSFFVVRNPTGSAGGTPTFSQEDLYTRRGDFSLDKDGYLVNGAGRYLLGTAIDPATGAASGTADVIKLSAGLVPAKPTTTIQFNGNLPSVPRTPAFNATVPGSDTYAAPSTGVTAAEENNFLNHTVAAGSVQIHDGVGTPTTVQLQWAKTGSNTWNLYYTNPNYDPTSTSSLKWIAAGQGTSLAAPPTTFKFSASGALTSPTTPTVALTDLKVDGATLNLDVSKGLTQYNDTSNAGSVNVRLLKQDGYAAGTVSDVSVTSDGQIVASYTNGVVTPLAKVAFAHFNAPNALKREDGSTFSQTMESGLPLSGLNGGAVSGGQLEGSNTDIAEEFSKMIVTQQAYSANTRVITTAQQMLQDTINIVR